MHMSSPGPLLHKTSKMSLYRPAGRCKDVFMFYEAEPRCAGSQIYKHSFELCLPLQTLLITSASGDPFLAGVLILLILSSSGILVVYSFFHSSSGKMFGHIREGGFS